MARLVFNSQPKLQINSWVHSVWLDYNFAQSSVKVVTGLLLLVAAIENAHFASHNFLVTCPSKQQVANPWVLFPRPELILKSLNSWTHGIGNWLSDSTRGHIINSHITNLKWKHCYCEYIGWNLIRCHVWGNWDYFSPVFANLFNELGADSKLEQVNADSNVLHVWVSRERHNLNLVLEVGTRSYKLHKITVQTFWCKILDREACDSTRYDTTLGQYTYHLVFLCGWNHAATVLHTDNKLQVEGSTKLIWVYFEDLTHRVEVLADIYLRVADVKPI